VDIDKPTLTDLFDKPRRYLVPLFQRPYVWGEQEQWGPLWEDVVRQAEGIQGARQGPLSTPAPRKHFLGAVVLGRLKTQIREVPAFQVVDGQQRLTTLQVVLSALLEASSALHSGNPSGTTTFLVDTLRRLTANPEPLVTPDERFKVWPTNADREAFADALAIGNAKALSHKYPKTKKKAQLQPPLVAAYLFFQERVWEYLEDKDARPGSISREPDHLSLADPAHVEHMGARAMLLFEALAQDFQLVSILLDVEEDPQVIFETLNARGVPLRPSDLVRNYLFLAAQRQHEDPEFLYNQFWLHFDQNSEPLDGEKKPFWKEEIKQGRYKRTRLDLFLFHYTILRTRQEVRIEHLFTEFRAWWEHPEALQPSGGRVVPATLADISRFSGHFRTLQIPDVSTQVGRFAARLKALDTSTVIPTALLLLERRKDIAETDFAGMLTDIESYLVRRAVCNLTTKGYNRIFLTLLKRLLEEKVPTRATLQTELLGSSGDSEVWPSDDRFHQAWMHMPVYKAGSAKARMILEALEQAERTSKQEPVQLTGPVSVEHVLPQREDLTIYPYEAAGYSDGANVDALAARRSRLKHVIGNLTLLTQELNSSVSNGPFPAKREAIAEQSALRLNVYFQKLAGTEGWNEGSINYRGEQLFEIARRIWPFPGVG
jgi:hypothetical protein